MVGIKVVTLLKPEVARDGEQKLTFEFPKARASGEIVIHPLNGGSLLASHNGIKYEIPKDRINFWFEDSLARTSESDEQAPVDKQRHAVTKFDRDELSVIVEGLNMLAAKEGLDLDYRGTARKLSAQLSDKLLRLKPTKDAPPPLEALEPTEVKGE